MLAKENVTKLQVFNQKLTGFLFEIKAMLHSPRTQWSCDVCTFKQNATVARCAMCNNANPFRVENVKKYAKQRVKERVDDVLKSKLFGEDTHSEEIQADLRGQLAQTAISNFERDNKLIKEVSEMKQIESMQSKIDELQAEVTRLQNDKERLQSTIDTLKTENRRLKMPSFKGNDYSEWGPQEICDWIINIENGKLCKYEEVLGRNLKEEEVTGEMLQEIDGADLKRWGISKFADIKMVLKQIGQLIDGRTHGDQSQTSSAALRSCTFEGVKTAPTVFI